MSCNYCYQSPNQAIDLTSFKTLHFKWNNILRCHDAHYFLYYQHGRHVEGINIIESSSGMRQGDALGGPLFSLAHYQTLLKTIAWAPNYVFPSLMDNTHIGGALSHIACGFDHFLTQLTLVGLKLKVSKCKL
jgi:hypothetical protein